MQVLDEIEDVLVVAMALALLLGYIWLFVY